ncbi:thioredoxin-like protein [Balneicella halophila]|uniref:Thioredoxin-like protein n=1 Tax=Balneicella halophila TaxID=1537566 RepID=A0A7L4URF1_BALHA|nr:thioredoxin-like domain-containing protein [Balneicella halophila]PVX52345.1 thioredoxin-like protein [Balneicella halophila]
MKKYILLVLTIPLFFIQCKKSEPTSFDTKALDDKVKTTQGETLTVKEMLNNYKGEIVLIDIWASWCGDCLHSLPTVKFLKEKYGAQVTFLYSSMDKDKEAWHKALEKYDIKGEHYYLGSEWKTNFLTSIELNWIPRFMILGKDGSIKLYNAKKADDPKIERILEKEIANN